MKMNARERLLAILTLICFGAYVGDKLLLTPLLNGWENRSLTIQDLQKSLNKGKLLLSRERDLRKRWKEMQHDALPQDMSQAENQMLNSVIRWTSESRITPISIKPVTKDFPDEKYTTLEFRAVLQGNLESIIHFIYALETDPLSIKVESLEIISRDEEGQLLTLSITFSGIQFQQEETTHES